MIRVVFNIGYISELSEINLLTECTEFSRALFRMNPSSRQDVNKFHRLLTDDEILSSIQEFTNTEIKLIVF
jgi:hypothetical protein